MQRPLLSNDFIFPAIAATGKLKIGTSVGRAEIEKMINMFVSGADILKGRAGKFTTHCFQRGGAQWCFMWRDCRWSLKAVKWWGGWAPTESVRGLTSSSLLLLTLMKAGTLMRYLLDEVSKYEHGYHDMLMPSRSYERHITFMGGTGTPSASTTFMPLTMHQHEQPMSTPLPGSNSSLLSSLLTDLYTLVVLPITFPIPASDRVSEPVSATLSLPFTCESQSYAIDLSFYRSLKTVTHSVQGSTL
jgi:hypothetical protein